MLVLRWKSLGEKEIPRASQFLTSEFLANINATTFPHTISISHHQWMNGNALCFTVTIQCMRKRKRDYVITYILYCIITITNSDCYDYVNEQKADNNKSKGLDHILFICSVPGRQTFTSSILYQKNTISCYKHITLCFLRKRLIPISRL